MFKKLNENARLPAYQTEYSGAVDLYILEDRVLEPGTKHLLPTGVSWEPPSNVVGLIRDRSSLAWKSGLMVTAGVIDVDYRDEIRVVLWNMSDETCVFYKHDRIAQMLILKYEHMPGIDVIKRTREGGFGTTGS